MNIELFHADFSQEWESLEPVDLILTDPPYNVLDDIHTWDKSQDWILLETIFSALLKPIGLVVLFCDLSLMHMLLDTFIHELRFKHYHIWKKPGGMPITTNRPINNAEFILIFRKRGTRERELTWNPEMMGERGLPYLKRNTSPDIPTRRMRKSKFNRNENGCRFPKTIIEAPSKPNMEAWERTNHPTQKPEILLRKLIRGYSNKGECVLDPFAGSGSTLVSAYKENRKAIGFEIDETYYQEAKKRIDSITKQVTMF